MEAKQIKETLSSLIKEASSVDSSLARRLDEIERWIKDVKPGSLIAKKFVLLFLLQVIYDSEVWLAIQTLPSSEERQAYYEEMTATEKYWYGELFPRWVKEKDPKFYIWKQKLMSGEFSQKDEDVLKEIYEEMKHWRGNVLQRYIADLSMATDIIVSSLQEKPLCVQLTTVSDKLSQQKAENWEKTLRSWEIDRGIFISYNPGEFDFEVRLVSILLDNSNHLQGGTYLRFSF